MNDFRTNTAQVLAEQAGPKGSTAGTEKRAKAFSNQVKKQIRASKSGSKSGSKPNSGKKAPKEQSERSKQNERDAQAAKEDSTLKHGFISDLSASSYSLER